MVLPVEIPAEEEKYSDSADESNQITITVQPDT